ncbi:MAG: transporter substrate-binding domain-containing protein [Desulfobacteraceae bacterium]|nr:transporter substrate-binding domain-containing protein [Desulfobacteraceae bacterium]MCB9494048.1 transporter substrate-binding domain-containing protein [Desulfobacteraceae bacterium]
MNRLMFFCFFFMILAQWVFADEIIIVTEQYPPYEFIENGEWTGHDADIVREASRRAGVNPVFKEYPWKRCLKMVEEGAAEALISAMKTPDREEYIIFPDTNLSYEKNVIFGRRGDALVIKSLDDLKGKTIGV